MTPAEAFAVCELTVRQFDPDRYFSALFAPSKKRPLLYALYAFNHEVARASETRREPIMGQIRLQWWREAAGEAYEGEPRAHPALICLAEVFSRACVDLADLEALVDARASELPSFPFPTLASMESHAQATSSAVMQIAARVLDECCDAAELTREAGIAYGLTGMLRSISAHAARGNLLLPEDLIKEESVTPTDALSGKHPAELIRVAAKVRTCATEHFVRAKAMGVPHSIVAAVLPTALVPAYNACLKRSELLRPRVDISQLRMMFILLRAALLTRL